MRTSLRVLLLTLCALAPVRADDPPASRPATQLPPLGKPAGAFGAALDEKTERVSLEALGKEPEKWAGKTILVEGQIQDVCQKKGCWMVLAAGEQPMRVKFKDYAFFVPRDAKGRTVLVQGQAKVEEIPEDVARHYAEEGGDPEKAKQIHGPQKGLSFLATGVEVLGSFELPGKKAEGDAAAVAALEQRLLAKGGPEDPNTTWEAIAPELALRALRGTPGARIEEFAAWTQVGRWYVFGLPGGATPFERGWAVHLGGGRVIQY